jgi:hypothetical protein
LRFKADQETGAPLGPPEEGRADHPVLASGGGRTVPRSTELPGVANRRRDAHGCHSDVARAVRTARAQARLSPLGSLDASGGLLAASLGGDGAWAIVPTRSSTRAQFAPARRSAARGRGGSGRGTHGGIDLAVGAAPHPRGEEVGPLWPSRGSRLTAARIQRRPKPRRLVAEALQEARQREIDHGIFKCVAVAGVDKPQIAQVGVRAENLPSRLAARRPSFQSGQTSAHISRQRQYALPRDPPRACRGHRSRMTTREPRALRKNLL